MTERKRDARQAIEDLELDKHLATAGAAAARLAQEAVSLVGTYADDHREQAHGLLDRAESEADRVTGGRATDLLGGDLPDLPDDGSTTNVANCQVETVNPVTVGTLNLLGAGHMAVRVPGLSKKAGSARNCSSPWNATAKRCRMMRRSVGPHHQNMT